MANEDQGGRVVNLAATFQQIYGHPPQVETGAPGRVNVLGEHVDYNDGIVLPAAIDRAVYLAAAPVTDGIVTLEALDLGKRVALRLDNLPGRIDVDGEPLPGWALYPAGVAWSLQQAGVPLGGVKGAYSSDVPIGAGLSASAGGGRA